MKKTTFFACFVLLMLTFTTGVALANTYNETINVTGGGTLSYTDVYSETWGKCIRTQEMDWSYTEVYGSFSYTVNGVTTPLTGSETVYTNYCGVITGANGISWMLPSDQLVFTPSGQTGGSAVVTQLYSGYLNPKYLIMGVTYAPPGGSQSYVSYSETNFVGTTSTITNSIANNYTESVSLSEGLCQTTGQDLAAMDSGVCVTGSQSSSWTLSSNSSNTITLSKQTSSALKTPGIPNVYSPVDHDYDIIWLWLNPVVTFTVFGTNNANGGSVIWTGYGYDYTDPLHEVDVWPVYVGYLDGGFKKADGTPCYATDATCDAQDANALSRSWVTTQTFASGQGPGITSADFPAILGADPFGPNPGYLVNLQSGTNPLTTTDGRFTQAGVNGVAPQTIPYKQAPPGSTIGENDMYTNTYTQTSTLGEGGSYIYSMGFGMEEKFGDGFFGLGVVYDFKQNWVFTWTNTWQNTVTNTTTQAQTLSITGPPCPAPSAPCDPEFTEPHEFAAYEDNLYGTFMFWPNPYFSIGPVTPATQAVKPGGSASYAIPTAANAGYSGTIAALSVTGLPSGTTEQFSPATGAAGTAFTLSVGTALTTPVGTYPLTISATDGSLSYIAYATLVVSAGPDFTIAATPASRTITVGAKTTYVVSTTALNGFTGVASLSLSGLPSGATAAFSPTSITGSGSSTLTVTTTTSMAPGTYTLTITGTSGSLVHSIPVTLIANVPDFSITATPTSQTISPGGGTTYTVTTTALRGFTGVVALQISGLPSGGSAGFNPASITGAGSSTLTVNSTASTPAGTYTLTITGTSGSLTHTKTVKLVVSSKDFSLGVSPESQGIAAGTNAVYTVTTTALGGFTGSVALSLTGLPSGTSAGFSPASIIGAGSSTLTITTSTSTALGNYTLTVTGTSGSLTHTATIVLTVNAT